MVKISLCFYVSRGWRLCISRKKEVLVFKMHLKFYESRPTLLVEFFMTPIFVFMLRVGWPNLLVEFSMAPIFVFMLRVGWPNFCNFYFCTCETWAWIFKQFLELCMDPVNACQSFSYKRQLLSTMKCPREILLQEKVNSMYIEKP